MSICADIVEAQIVFEARRGRPPTKIFLGWTQMELLRDYVCSYRSAPEVYHPYFFRGCEVIRVMREDYLVAGL